MKIKAFALALLTMFMATVSTSCGDTKSKEQKVEYKNPIDFVNNNLNNELFESQVPTHKKLKYNSALTKNYFQSIDTAYIDKGFVIVENTNGYIGVYSLTHDVFILGCNYYKEWVNYHVFESSLATLIKVDYEGKTKIIDNLGNTVIEQDYVDDSLVEFNPFIYDNTIYLEVFIDGYPVGYKYVDGKLQNVHSLPNPDYQETPDLNKNDGSYHIGDLFREGYITNLKEFGKPGYYLLGSSKGLITLFNSQNTKVSTFYIPTSAKPVITKDEILYQDTIRLYDEATKYSYFDRGSKYSLSTHRIDLKTGGESFINLNYLLKDATPLKDESQQYLYTLATIAEIDENKILCKEKEVVLDSKFNIIGDYSTFHLSGFVKLSNGNYYNIISHILYDSFLKPITYLDEIHPTYDYTKNIFKGEINNRYGLINENGKVVLQFEYITLDIKPGFDYCLGQNIDGTYDLINLNNFKTKFTFDSNPICLNPNQGVYVYDSYNETELTRKIFTLDGFTYDLNSEQTSSDYILINQLNDCGGYIIETDDKFDTFVFEDSINAHADLNDDDQIASPRTGRTLEDAILLSAGENKIHGLNDQTTLYAKLDTTARVVNINFYDLYTPDAAYCIEKGKELNYENLTQFSPYSYSTFTPHSNYDYYLELDFSSTTSNYGTIFIDELETSEFTGETEYFLGYENTVYKTISNVEDGYCFKFTERVYSYTIFQFTNGVPSSKDFNYVNVNGSYLNVVNDECVVAFHRGYYDDENSYFKLTPFDTSNFPAYDSSIVTLDSKSHYIYSFVPENSFIYELELNDPDFIYLDVYANGKKLFLNTNKYGLKCCYLEAGKTYFVDLYNASYNSKDAKVDIWNNVITDFEVINENSTVTVNPNQNYFKLTIYDASDYLIENGALFDELLIVPESNKNIKTKVWNNDVYCHLDPDTYYINIVNATDTQCYTLFNSINFHDSDIKINDIFSPVTIDGKNYSGVGYTGGVSGYYKIITDCTEYDFDLYRITTDGDYYNEKISLELINPNTDYGISLYKFNSYTNYCILFDNLSNSNRFTFDLEYDCDNLASHKGIIIDSGSFQNNVDDHYISTNHTNNSYSYMTITATTDCNLSFYYNISSESNYDEIKVSKNGSYLTLSGYTSGNHSGQHFQTYLYYGDVIKIYYSKDSSGDSGADRLDVYNITCKL